MGLKKLLIGGILVFSIFYSKAAEKNILILNSYHNGLYWTDEIMKGIKTIANSVPDINFYTEYLDSKRFISYSYFELFRQFLDVKYSGFKFDAIICTDNAALDFLLKYNNDPLFAKSWKVSCGINNVDDVRLPDSSYYCVFENDYFVERIFHILSVLPKTKSIRVLIDKTDLSNEFRRKFLLNLKNVNNIPRIEFYDESNPDSLNSYIKKLQPGDVIDYFGINFDDNGKTVNRDQIGLDIIKNSPVPVFCNSEYFIGKGIMGGIFNLGFEQGSKALDIALKLCSGKANTLKSHLFQPSDQYIYDYTILKKYNAKMDHLPVRVKLINTPDTKYAKYKFQLFLGLLAITLLSGIIILLLLNISKRRKSEANLLISEQKFKDIAELLPQIVYECDMSGNITFVNNQGIEIFGFKKEDLEKGINIFNLFENEEVDHIKNNIKKLIAGNAPENRTFIAVRKDGTKFPLSFHSNVIYREDKPVGLRGIGVDMTIQKEFELQLIAAREKAEQSDRLKSAFLSNMSHEIRTPLNSIVGFSYLLAEDPITPGERKEYFSYVQNSADHLLNLINDIIDFSKIEAGQLTINYSEFSISAMMNEIYAQFNAAKIKKEKEHIRLEYLNQQENQQIFINSDPLRVKQLLTNLLDNAFKFTDDGSITFGYSIPDENHIQLFVKDTGVGISETDKELVFKRFYKLTNNASKIYSGSGLGLSICKHLVKLMNGKIWLESELGRGTTFYILLPSVVKSGSHDAFHEIPTQDSDFESWKNKSILIVEDEQSNYELIFHVLKKTGANLIHAVNGQQAIDIVKTSDIHLILMDIQMPVMNGYDSTKIIKSLCPDIPIIAITAYAMAGEKDWIMQAGSDDYLSKPINPNSLVESIQQLLFKQP